MLTELLYQPFCGVYKLIHELVKSNSGAPLLVKHFSYHVGVNYLRDKILQIHS